MIKQLVKIYLYKTQVLIIININKYLNKIYYKA